MYPHRIMQSEQASVFSVKSSFFSICRKRPSDVPIAHRISTKKHLFFPSIRVFLIDESFFSQLHRPFRRQKGLLRKSCNVDDGIGRGLPNASVYSLSYVSKRKEIHVLSYANSIS